MGTSVLISARAQSREFIVCFSGLPTDSGTLKIPIIYLLEYLIKDFKNN